MTPARQWSLQPSGAVGPNCVRCADASELREWSSEVPVGIDTPCSPLVLLLPRVTLSILALAVEETTRSRLVLLLWKDNMGLLALSEHSGQVDGVTSSPALPDLVVLSVGGIGVSHRYSSQSSAPASYSSTGIAATREPNEQGYCKVNYILKVNTYNTHNSM